jgi:transcription-repair coupling factor (superfamily II helicase)
LNLTELLHLIEEMPAYGQLVEELEQERQGTGAAVLDAAKPYLIASLHQRLATPMVIVTTQPENSKRLYEQLLTWCPSMDVKLLPEPETLPYEYLAVDTATP